MGHSQPEALPMGNFAPVAHHHAWCKPRVLFLCFLSLLVLRAAEECTTPPAITQQLDLDAEMRMETIAHIAAIMAQQMNCKPSPGTYCLSDKKLLQKFMLLQDWAAADEGWDRLFSAYLLFHDAVGLLRSNQPTDAIASLDQAMAYKVFPYSDTKLLEHWQRALAMPGKLFRKQRLDLADVLMLAADSRLEIGQVEDDLGSLEEALKSLELSLSLREAEGVPDFTEASQGYAQTLRKGIIHAVNDIVPRLKVKQLQGLLAERGLPCTGCIEKMDLMQKLVPALRLPIKMDSAHSVLEDKAASRLWMARQDGEDGVSFLHRVLTSIVTSLGSVVLQEADAQCTAPSRSGCLSFTPAWASITAPLLQQQNFTQSSPSSQEEHGEPGSTDPAKPEGARSWRLLDQLRIPGTGSGKPAADSATTAPNSDKPSAKHPPGQRKQGKCGAGKSCSKCNTTGAEALSRQWVEPGHLVLPPGRPLPDRSGGGTRKGICHQIGAHPGCEDGSCIDICSLLDNMLELEVPDLGSVMNILHRGAPLQAAAESLSSMARSRYENDWSGGGQQAGGHQQPGGGFVGDVSPGRDSAGGAAHPGPHHHMGGFAGFGGASDDAFRSERDRKLQEQLNRRSRDGAGQYRDDPMVPLTLCGVVLAIGGVYLARKHRRSLSRVMSSWFSSRGGVAGSASGLGTSISKERQAAAAALRAALARPDISITDLARCLEAAEATDVEGPLVRRGNQTLAQRRRRERDLAEAARSKAKAAKDREMARAKEEARHQEVATAAAASMAAPAGIARVKSSPVVPNNSAKAAKAETPSKYQRSKSDSKSDGRRSKPQQLNTPSAMVTNPYDVPAGSDTADLQLRKGKSESELTQTDMPSVPSSPSSSIASSQELGPSKRRSLSSSRKGDTGAKDLPASEPLSPTARSSRSMATSAASSEAGEDVASPSAASSVTQTPERPKGSIPRSPTSDAPTSKALSSCRQQALSPPQHRIVAPVSSKAPQQRPMSRGGAVATKQQLQQPQPPTGGAPANVHAGARITPGSRQTNKQQQPARPGRQQPAPAQRQQQHPTATAAAPTAVSNGDRPTPGRPHGTKWNQVAALNGAGATLPATAKAPAPSIPGSSQRPDPAPMPAPARHMAGPTQQKQQPGFLGPQLSSNPGMSGGFTGATMGISPPSANQPQPQQLHGMNNLLHHARAHLPMEGSSTFAQPGRYPPVEPGLDYLNTLSQQQLPGGLSSQLNPSATTSMFSDRPLALSGEGRGIFPATLAAIWGDGPEQASAFGSALPQASAVDDASYQPFGGSSIWGSSTSPAASGLGALNDMSFLDGALGSLGWSLQPDTAPPPAAATNDGNRDRNRS